jgi:hypothetical protein
MPPAWPDEIDDVLAGDLTAALSYVTPADGAVVTAVAPIGLRDRDAGIVTFTTSLGLGKKLERMKRNPRIALAYHRRDHGFSRSSSFVLVQGDADITAQADRDYLEEVVSPSAERFMGPPRRGRFWDRWLQEYYADRVPVNVTVRRIVSWPDLRCEGEPTVHVGERPASPPASQPPPAKGTGPRVDARRAARRVGELDDVVLSWVEADGYPTVAPVEIGGADEGGIHLAAVSALLPPGARRAGLLGHSYGTQLLGLRARQHTGWLEVAGADGRAVYAPHTEQGFRAPNNKTLLLLANGLVAKRGLRKARREGKAA